MSDVDSDIETEELVSTYVSTKARLYKLRPELVEEDSSRKKPSKAPQSKPEYSLLPGIRKLQEKLRRIESDTLFDGYEANLKWASERLQIVRDEPQYRNRGVTKTQHKIEFEKSNSNSAQLQSASPTLFEDSDSSDDEVLLGDMFAVPNDTPRQEIVADGEKTRNPQVRLRDFGKFTGLSPRRVLEEACRAR